MAQIDSPMQKFAALDRIKYLYNQQDIRTLQPHEEEEIADLEEAVEYFENNNY